MLKFIVAAVLAAQPIPAFAHATLVGSTPAAGTSVSRPNRITLNFDDALQPSTAGAEIVMTAMPGMADHPPMTIKAFAIEMANNNTTMHLVLRNPLPTGSYTVRWSAANTDKHHSQGSIDFSVK